MGDVTGDINDVQTNIEATIKTWKHRGFVRSMAHSYHNHPLFQAVDAATLHPLFQADDPVLHNYADRLALTEVRIAEAREGLKFSHNTYANTQCMRGLRGEHEQRRREMVETLTKMKMVRQRNEKNETASALLPGKRQCQEQR